MCLPCNLINFKKPVHYTHQPTFNGCNNILNFLQKQTWLSHESNLFSSGIYDPWLNTFFIFLLKKVFTLQFSWGNPAWGYQIEYCKYRYLDAPTASPNVVKTWDDNFMKYLVDDHATLFEFTKASNYLVIQNILELMCQTIANLMKGKNTEDMHDIFSVYNVN